MVDLIYSWDLDFFPSEISKPFWTTFFFLFFQL